MKTPAGDDITAEVSRYISAAGEPPAPVIEKAKHHILDTLAAIVSGSKLRPGEFALRYVADQRGTEEAQVGGSALLTSAINAALANGMMAHADETDDSHPRSLTHPGCAVVPAALAMSERVGADGITFLRAVVAGYDIGCRVTQALGVKNLRSKIYRSTHSIGGNFGAAAAASAAARLTEDRARYALSYAAQQASGAWYVLRDQEHIEKAFVFGGMPARNGVTAAVLAQLGFTGVRDPFGGGDTFFALSADSRPHLLAEDLGSRYEIMFTNIKRFSVGSPIQAPLDALLLLMKRHRFTHRDVRSVTVRVPDASVVNNRSMPDINLQHVLAVALVDGDLTFEQAHSYQRMSDPAVVELRKRITLVESPELAAAGIPRQGIVEVTTTDGAELREHVVSVRGTVENPMTTEEVEKKCRELLTPVLGDDRATRLIDRVWHLEQVSNVRELRPLLSA